MLKRRTREKMASNEQVFSVFVPKNQVKKHHVMRFNGNLNVDFAHWKEVNLKRENNLKQFKTIDDDQPKFGAGSEYNRDAREEARRKKLGIKAKVYQADQQPWILNVGGKSGKKFKGKREGGISDNAAYYVFTNAPDGTIQAYPLNEWYNFNPINRYKSLTAEEAEEEFNKKQKRLNMFSIMMQKRLRGDDDDDEETITGGSKTEKLKISEMEEWIEDSGSDSELDSKDKRAENSDDEGKKKKKTVKSKPKPKKKRDLDEEAFEESDDGDEEGRELEYNTDSSEE